MSSINNLKDSTEYMEMRFQYESELISYAQDQTDTGVFNKNQFNKFDNETKILVANDLKSQFNIYDYL